MPEPVLAPAPSGLSLGDIYYIVFRHKWKILACTAAGIGAAFAVWNFDAPPYNSEAKLYVRYVLSERGLGPTNADTSAKSPDQRGETIMNSEAAILTSIDSMRQVAQTIGPDKILAKAGGGNDLTAATAVVKKGLSVDVPRASSVIDIVFTHPDPAIVQPVLRQIVAQYLKLHVETHTANGAMGDFLTQETDQLRSRLNQTEDELRKATAKAGVISVDEAKKSYADQISSIRRDLYAAEAELAERSTAYDELTKRLSDTPTPAPAAVEAPVPVEILDEYRSASTQYMLLERMEQELLTQFTPQNPRVVEVHTQAVKADETRRKLLEKYPRLAQVGAVAERGPADPANGVTAMATQITGLKARVAVLKAQLTGLNNEVAKLEQMEGTIVELRRKKDLEESNYRYFAASLEQARINETLGNGRVSNIIEIQSPSPPFLQPINVVKKLGLIAAAGLALGLGWAFAIELYFDRSIKRPIDVERTLGSPLLISIPRLRGKHVPQLTTSDPKPDGAAAPNGHAVAGIDAALLPYHETLRDRLIAYFESIGLNHKPKLVAVTALDKKAGVSTTAAGLARSLSETGEGNVLLVDMNAPDGSAQQFTKGHAVRGLDDVLQQPNGDHVQPKLYVVTETPPQDRLWHSMPRRFTSLVPKMKASDFDYIIFDMPPVSQISITPRLAGFMDLVLLVIESERTDRDLVQRATKLLAQSRASVGVVLNRTRRYVPARLHQELALSA